MATRRSTRVRKVIPIDEKILQETEEDADFWGQDAFADDEDDDAFDHNELSDQGEDVVDSDFDAPEAADTDTGDAAEKEARAVERSERKKSGTYVDPAKKKSKRKPPLPPATTDAPEEKKVRKSEPPATTRRPPSLRNSTRRASLKAAERREQQDKETAKRRAQKAARDAKKKPVRELTQEERLAEAVKTEEANRESLKDLLRLEEERKRLPTRKKTQTGPMMSIRDRDGIKTISMPADVNANEVLFPQMVVNDKSQSE